MHYLKTETIAKRVLVRDMPDRSRIVATFKIEHLGNNAHPYFSATGEVYEPNGWNAGGMCHDEILRAFPRMAPFVAMHLSDWPSGEPMHALTNGRYFYFDRHFDYERRTYGQDYVNRHGTGRERCARILRCAVDDLPENATKEEFEAFVNAQRLRWAREAQEARALLDTIKEETS